MLEVGSPTRRVKIFGVSRGFVSVKVVVGKRSSTPVARRNLGWNEGREDFTSPTRTTSMSLHVILVRLEPAVATEFGILDREIMARD